MKTFPKAKCPKCGGPVSFMDVVSIVTPFQSISCMSCGVLIFLRNKWGLTLLSIGVGLFVTLSALAAIFMEMAPDIVIFGAALLILVSVEVLVTAHVIRHRGLVIRRND